MSKTNKVKGADTSIDLWKAYKKLFVSNKPIALSSINQRVEAFEKWEAKVIEEMGESEIICKSTHFWGGYKSIKEFTERKTKLNH